MILLIQPDARYSLAREHEILVASLFCFRVPRDTFTTLFADNSIVDVLKIFTRQEWAFRNEHLWLRRHRKKTH